MSCTKGDLALPQTEGLRTCITRGKTDLQTTEQQQSDNKSNLIDVFWKSPTYFQLASIWTHFKRGNSSQNYTKVFFKIGCYVSNKKALMAGNYIGLEFYCASPPLIPTQSLCADKPVSKSIGLVLADCLWQEGAVPPYRLISGMNQSVFLQQKLKVS